MADWEDERKIDLSKTALVQNLQRVADILREELHRSHEQLETLQSKLATVKKVKPHE